MPCYVANRLRVPTKSTAIPPAAATAIAAAHFTPLPGVSAGRACAAGLPATANVRRSMDTIGPAP